MTFKPFTNENAEKNFILAKRLMEIILFLILAIQLFEEFVENNYFTHFTIILSHVGAVVFVLGMLNKYMSSNAEDRIYQDQTDIVSFYDNFLGSILIPMIFLYDIDNVIFNDATVKNLDLAKQIILVVAFVSAVFSRFILRLADKYSQQFYKQPEKGGRSFDIILILNYFNAILNFLLCCFFWYLSISMKWKNAFSGEAIFVAALIIIICVMMPFYFENKKH